MNIGILALFLVAELTMVKIVGGVAISWWIVFSPFFSLVAINILILLVVSIIIYRER